MMNRFVLAACAGLLAAATASPSFAADMPGPYYKAPDFAAPFSWTGFYLGINGGYGWGTSNWTNTTTGIGTGDFAVNGELVGGTIGYNLQTGVWVWGLEGDIDASWMTGSTTAACAGTCTTDNTWLGTARGRIGYAWGRFLPYVTGGAAFGDIKMTPPADASSSQVRLGWTVGAGFEYAFAGAWSGKIEYLYADLGTASCGSATCVAAGGIDVPLNAISIVRGGVNYRF